MTTTLRVIKDLRGNEEKYFIVREENIECGNYSDTYDNYGNQVSLENEDDDYAANFISWWTGNNWESYILESDIDYRDGELLDQEDKVSISILAAYEQYDHYIESGDGKTEEIDGWEISSCLYPTMELAVVNKV